MHSRVARFFMYVFFIVGVVLLPLDMPKKKIKQMHLTSNVVSVILIQAPQKKKKKKVVKKVIKKTKPKKKPKPKPRKRLKPKPKPKARSKPKPILKQIEPKQDLEVKEEEITPQKVEVKTEDDSQQKLKQTLAKQAEKTYYDTIYEVISENKRYPKRARRYKKEGSVKVNFMVLRDGSITNFQLIKLSKHKSLNKAVKKLFEKLRSFPKPPSNLSFPLELSIMINYKLRR